jgi:DNA-3-methyladenine glycosylase I
MFEDQPITSTVIPRCSWASGDNLMVDYHDTEWGVPVHNDRLLFEFLNLEGAQAGLSWLTILKRRQGYRRAFDNFEAEKIAHYDQAKKLALLQDIGIIRNRLKIEAVIYNAGHFLLIQKEFGTFDTYIWSYVDNRSLTNSQAEQGIVISQLMSSNLKKRGFRFVGPTICYAFMQATGMINDHESNCFRVKNITMPV